MSESKMSEARKVLEARKDTVQDLVIHLNKITDEELMENDVETIIEGFWQSRYAQAQQEGQPFKLEGE